MRAPDESVDPSSDEHTELDGVVRSIGDHARTVNLTRAAGLSAALDRAAVGQLPDVARGTAAELAHQLVGSAGTFGFSGVSDLASELEHFFTAGDFEPERVAAARLQMRDMLAQLSADPDF